MKKKILITHSLSPIIRFLKLIYKKKKKKNISNHALIKSDHPCSLGRMTDEINEIIRVLQLTTYDEDEWDADNLTVMKKALNAVQGKQQGAKDWLRVRGCNIISLI